MWRKCEDCGKRFSKKGGPGRRCKKCQKIHVEEEEKRERAEISESIRIKNKAIGRRK